MHNAFATASFHNEIIRFRGEASFVGTLIRTRGGLVVRTAAENVHKNKEIRRISYIN